MRIIFAGTPDFSVPALMALLASDDEVVAVYTQPDRPSGRGRKLTASPVKLVAEQAGIPVYQPDSLRDAEQIQQLRDLNPDLMVVVAYGLILPAQVLEIPRIDCINIHASLLPRWRGAAPIQRAIISGDEQTGVTIMRMETKLDTGPVYLTRSIPIQTQTSEQLFKQLAESGAEALLSVIPEIQAGTIEPQVQDESQATYASKLSKEEARLDWNQPARALERQVRGLNPWPVAYTMFNDKRLRIWNAKTVAESKTQTIQHKPGQIISDGRQQLMVMTGEGLLELTEVQLPGGKRLTASQFLNANQVDGICLT
ncbi:MAG TPA: methionyl-tRNA formyltransferase [Crenotrichaceae bacterium]|nr:methionyl-tRNA formyltransferase [Crenotrichaceae bacterium]